MNILYFQGLGEPDSPRVELEAITRYSDDRAMAEFDNIELSHVDLDDAENVTLYCKNTGFYVTLTRKDIASIAQAACGLALYFDGSDQPNAQGGLYFFDEANRETLVGRLGNIGLRVFLEPTMLEGTPEFGTHDEWSLAKVGWKLIKNWVLEQRERLGEDSEAHEILIEWIDELCGGQPGAFSIRVLFNWARRQLGVHDVAAMKNYIEDL